MKEQRLFLSRVIAAAVLVVLLTGVLVWRLVQLQIVDYQRFSERSRGNQIRIEPLAPTRGLIFDRNGLVVAENLPTWQLVVVPEQIEDLDAVLDELESLELLEDANREELIQLVRSHRSFERVAISNLSESQAARFAVRRHRFQGVDIQEGLFRYYPFAEAAAHASGYVGRISSADLEVIDRGDYAATSQIGKTGVERRYETLLHGHVGYRQQIVNVQGRVLLDSAESSANSTRGTLETRWPAPGANVVLSLDMRLQLAAQDALGNMRGAVVALDPRNGDVLALVSTPSFDPNRFATGLSRSDFVALNNDPDKPLFNRAVAGNYPPGSTIKPFLALGALHHESVDPAERPSCRGFFTLPRSTHRYREPLEYGHGEVDLHAAIVKSCDVYFYQLAVDLGIDRIHEFLLGFGFNGSTGIDIAGESSGLIPSRDWKRRRFSRREEQEWTPGETVITGIGQGFMQVTPLQLAHAGAVLATRGSRFQPRLLIGAEDSLTGEMQYTDPVPLAGPAAIDPEHWQLIHDAMHGVTSEPGGTARSAMLGTPYSVAGKTGTAQVYSIAQEEEYDEELVDTSLRDHGLFFAFAPAEAPEIVVAVVVENGGGGSRSAAPVTRRILDLYFENSAYVAQQR